MGKLTSNDAMITILIFGAAVRPDGQPSTALRQRVEAALLSAKNHPDCRFIPTGAVGKHGPSEASVMARLLTESGVDSDRIQLEETGYDTLSSVRAIRRLSREHGSPGPVMVATHAYHIPRCLTLLCLFGIAARQCSVLPDATGDSRWNRWYWRLREVPALPYDVILALWWRLTGLS